MKATSVLVVCRNSEVSTLAHSAAQVAFPHGSVNAASSLKTVLGVDVSSDIDLLVLIQPSKADVTQAFGVTDSMGVARWPIVVLGKTPPAEPVHFIGPEDWNEALVARVFGFAVREHSLLQELGRARGDLFTISRRICHDLRTPLGAIVTSAEVLKEVLEVEDKANALLTQSIFESTDELTLLIERLGFLTRATVNPRPMEMVSVESVVATALFRMEKKIRAHNATVTQPTLWPEAIGVAAWMEKTWLNLLANALKHGGPNPQIEIGWQKDPDGELRFWMADQGEGVPADQHKNLFRPFHELHDPNAGHGLGLSIVERLVDLQGGRCGYDSLPNGKGRFYFTLASADSAESPDATKPKRKRPLPVPLAP